MIVAKPQYMVGGTDSVVDGETRTWPGRGLLVDGRAGCGSRFGPGPDQVPGHGIGSGQGGLPWRLKLGAGATDFSSAFARIQARLSRQRE